MARFVRVYLNIIACLGTLLLRSCAPTPDTAPAPTSPQPKGATDTTPAGQGASASAQPAGQVNGNAASGHGSNANSSNASSIPGKGTTTSGVNTGPLAPAMPSSTPAATPHPAGTRAAGGPKKGMAMFKFAGSKGADAGASWYYNWTPAPFAGSSGNLEFVPMINGRDRYDDSTFDAIKASGAKYLLAFNEPDFSGQSNMSVAQVISAWPKFVATGLILGSPAISSNEQWLADFMSQIKANNYRLDFIAIHRYPDATSPTAVDDYKAWLTKIHDTYNLPIWLTEFGISDCGNWNDCVGGQLTQEVANHFVTGMLTMLDSLPFVERYAWFADAYTSGYSKTNVFDNSGALTATGQAFSSVSP